MAEVKKLRVGVIGCGGIAQMMHLPFLAKHDRLFEMASLCDLSPRVLAALGERYGVPPEQRFQQYEDLLAQDLDAVLVTSGGDHTPQVTAALSAGKHVFVEKPLCYTLADTDAMAALASEKNLALMVGYMKRFDPGYRHAQERIAAMGELRYAQINTLHPEEDDFLSIHGLIPASDVPADALEAARAHELGKLRQAVGHIPAYLQAEYSDVLLGSMVHDINAMRGLLGEPERVLFAEHWPAGEKPGGITATIQYPGTLRVVYTWIFLPGLRDYFQEIALMSASSRVRIQFPSPYLRNFPTPVIVQHMQAGAAVEERVIVSYEEAFEQELLAFHDCAVTGAPPLTGAADARADMLVLQQILAALNPPGLGGEAARSRAEGQR